MIAARVIGRQHSFMRQQGARPLRGSKTILSCVCIRTPYILKFLGCFSSMCAFQTDPCEQNSGLHWLEKKSAEFSGCLSEST